MILWFLAGIGTFLCSWLLTYMYRHYAINRSLVDIPNHRSSHQVPTPRGGGIAIVITYLLAISVLQNDLVLSLSNWAAFLLPGILLSVVAYCDDRGHIRAGWRLFFQIIAALLATYFTGGVTSIYVFGYEINSHWWLSLLAIMGLVWLINLYNFMDGIDGIAGLTAISVLTSVSVLLWLTDLSALLIYLSVLLIAATTGFLWFNFPKASIFMGDVGSCFLGLMLGIFILMAGRENPAFYWAIFILLGTFILDATVTLIRRAWRGEKVYMAHREHAYQHLSRRWQSHTKVTLIYSAIIFLMLLPAAILVVKGYVDGAVACFVCYFFLGYWLWASGAGTPQEKSLTGIEHQK